MPQSGELVQEPERIRGGRGLHGFSLGWVQKDEKINISPMYPQRTARGQVLERNTSRGGSEFCRGATGCSNEGREQVMGDASALVRCSRVVNWYKNQNASDEVVACTDSAWAGCRRTRRSTSGRCIHRGPHVVKFWSETQAVVALSSAEAQLGAAMKAGSM